MRGSGTAFTEDGATMAGEPVRYSKSSRVCTTSKPAPGRTINSENALVVGTSNRSELLLGYFTKHGDGACDFMPLGALYKTEVFEIAKAAGVSEEIISKTPTAGLYKSQTDEEELGYSYMEIDPVLRAFADKKKSESELRLLFECDLVERVLALVGKNKHKLERIPVAEMV